MKTILRSAGALLAGIITVIALSVGTDVIMEITGIFPPPWMGPLKTPYLLIALIYRCIFTIAGGYVTAALAPAKPLLHASWLGIIGTVSAIIGAFAAWDLSAHWYPVALIITALPCTWLGGRLKNKKTI